MSSISLMSSMCSGVSWVDTMYPFWRNLSVSCPCNAGNNGWGSRVVPYVYGLHRAGVTQRKDSALCSFGCAKGASPRALTMQLDGCAAHPCVPRV